jgi:putative ABC transport system permease protein
MGKIVLVARLAARDLRRHKAQAVLLLLAITAAATTLTLGLALNGVTNHPYQQTRAATNGPDLVAQYGVAAGNNAGPAAASPAQIQAETTALTHLSGVAEYSGPFPVATALLRARGLTVQVIAEGREQATSLVDHPVLTAGSWVRPGGVVLERTFAAALGVGVGGRVTLDGQQYTVAGIAVTASTAPYPNLCNTSCLITMVVPSSVVLAVVAAVAGLVLGWATAPLITNPGAGLIGTAGAPSITPTAIVLTLAVALAVALASTLVPAVKAARTSTVSALADSPRPPGRRAGLISLSARLPVPLLLGVRMAARRVRRAVLGAASVAVTSAGIVAVLTFRATAGKDLGAGSSPVGDPVVSRDTQMLVVITVVLVTLAILNAVCAAWATVLDSRRSAALSRALGASPQQVSAGVAWAQVLPALPGALLGIPLGLGLFLAADGGGVMVVPSVWQLAAAMIGILAAVTLMASIPALIGTRIPASQVLQAETA